MPCFHPSKAWLSTAVDGKRKVHFHPFSSSDQVIWLPCNQCIFCRIHRAVEWSARLYHESTLHRECCFITLTYNPESVEVLPNGLMTLPDYNTHASHFLKRLRKFLEPRKIRYYMVGEYGSESARPHYHAIIFGWNPPDRQHFKLVNDHFVDISKQLQALWDYGFTSVEDCNPHTIGYIAKYCMKKITGKAAELHYNGRRPEQQHMSLKPGIGAEWCKRYWSDMYKIDHYTETVIRDILIYNEKNIRPPKYYDKLFKDIFPAGHDFVMRTREQYARDLGDPDLAELKRKEEYWLYCASHNLKDKAYRNTDNRC